MRQNQQSTAQPAPAVEILSLRAAAIAAIAKSQTPHLSNCGGVLKLAVSSLCSRDTSASLLPPSPAALTRATLPHKRRGFNFHAKAPCTYQCGKRHASQSACDMLQ